MIILCVVKFMTIFYPRGAADYSLQPRDGGGGGVQGQAQEAPAAARGEDGAVERGEGGAREAAGGHGQTQVGEPGAVSGRQGRQDLQGRAGRAEGAGGEGGQAGGRAPEVQGQDERHRVLQESRRGTAGGQQDPGGDQGDAGGAACLREEEVREDPGSGERNHQVQGGV